MKGIGQILLTVGASLAVAVSAVQAAEPKPGDVIDASNVEQYQDYLLEGFVELVRRGETLKVIPTTPSEELITAKWRAATEANRGKAVLLDEYGTVGLADGSPWIGGTPFPEPKTGLEVMVNFQYCNLGLEADDWGSTRGPYAPLTRMLYLNQGGQYKYALAAGGEIHTTARLTYDPKPVIPGYEDELLRRYIAFIDPYDIKGIVTLDIQYRDQRRLPDSYIYLPTFRRVRRVSTANRADSLAGSEFTQSDISAFSDPLGLWKFRIVERRPMLISISNAPPWVVHPEPVKLRNTYFLDTEIPVEVRDAYVIEATPRFKTIYSKKLLVIDAEVFRTAGGTFYDNQGKLYKAVKQYWGKDPDGYPEPRWLLLFNLQTGSATLTTQTFLKANTNPPLRLFQPAAMKEFSR